MSDEYSKREEKRKLRNMEKNIKALIRAIKKGRIDVIETLSKENLGNDIIPIIKEERIIAIENGNLDVVKCLDRCFILCQKSSLVTAAMYGHLEIVTYLAESDTYYSNHKEKAFYAAVNCGHIEVVKYLMTKFKLRLMEYKLLTVKIKPEHEEVLVYLKSQGYCKDKKLP
jgi:hypothetical protein